MPSGPRGRSTAVFAALAAFPNTTAARPIDPTVVVDTSTPVRAVGSFVLVLVSGGTVLYLSEEFVDRSVDASMESPVRSVLYGILAQVSVVFLGAYAVGQLAGIGSVGPLLSAAGIGIVAVLWIALSGLGFTVVGASATDAAGERQLWPGLAIGAAVAASVWLLPTFLSGLLAWIVVVSIGIGGPTKEWLHASKGADAETEVDA